MATFHRAQCVVTVTFLYVQKDRKSLAPVLKLKTLTRSVTLNELLTLKLSAKWIFLKTAAPLCKKHACTMLIKTKHAACAQKKKKRLSVTPLPRLTAGSYR